MPVLVYGGNASTGIESGVYTLATDNGIVWADATTLVQEACIYLRISDIQSRAEFILWVSMLLNALYSDDALVYGYRTRALQASQRAVV